MLLNGTAFRDLLTESFPQIRTQLEEFPSGAFMIDLTIHGEDYVIESVSEKTAGTDGYGLSRQRTAVYGWEGIDRLFETPAGLLAEIGRILNS